MPCVENLVSYCSVLFVLIHVDSTRVKLIIIVLYTDKIAKRMYLNVDDDDETDDDELNPQEVKSIESNDNKIKKENGSNEKLPEKVKSDGGVNIKDEDTDNETDNDTHPSQVESNDKIKKENYGPYDDDTVNGEEQPEDVKSNDKIKKENCGPYDDDTVNGEEQPMLCNLLNYIYQ